MSLLICLPESMNPDMLSASLKSLDSSLKVEIGPEMVNKKEEVEFAVVWDHKDGILLNYPNLKCILSYGHGVDKLLADTQLPADVPIVRLKSKKMADSMNEYLLTVVLMNRRQLLKHALYPNEFEWNVSSSLNLNSIGILGLGFLGISAAQHFIQMGFQVKGWSRSEKNIKNVKCYSGNKGLIRMLEHTDYLINLLPLTIETQSLLNSETLSNLKRGAYFINVGRGKTLEEKDLIPLIDDGQLSGACLDVFKTEPLPKNHPFWKHKNILITPHNSSTTPHSSVAPQIIENYRRAICGEELLNLVDVKLGY